MYETEINRRRESSSQIPPRETDRFAESSQNIVDRTVLPWSEHCTECVWPTCYSSCDLYRAREDGRCRRFVDGMVRVDCPTAANEYLLKIRFKRWGKLWSPGNIRLRPLEKAQSAERRDYRIGSFLGRLPLPGSMRTFLTGRRYSFKNKLAHRRSRNDALPTAFLLECFNPTANNVALCLTIRSLNPDVKVPFQKLLQITPGFSRTRVFYDEIAAGINLGDPFNIELIPNDTENEITLFFGLMDFVREKPLPQLKSNAPPKDAAKKVKCVVWDLDNTVWDGILVEDGVDKLRLKDGILEIIRQLDERGILCSVASKNNPEEAIAALKKFSLAEYFLAPQISWNPKSEAVAAIARKLNIGQDTLLFVDDAEFERRQVEMVLPDVRTLDAALYRSIVDLPGCQVPVTDESRTRRKMYRVEEERQGVANGFGDDYLGFLRYCQIQMNIRPMDDSNLERVHELTQRTNQMNFSGNRYDRAVLRQILSESHFDTYVIDVEDRYGTYGVVGFSIVDNRMPLMTDLMFSCRVQSKRVEHAFLTYLLKKYVAENKSDFWANYRKTSRNAPSGRVFEDMGMHEVEVKDGVTRLIFPKNRSIPDDRLISVHADEQSLVGQV